jgi:hypothetical protein
MKVAIVGTTAKLSAEQTDYMRRLIYLTLKDYPKDTIIISGGAKGVDKIAVEIATDLDLGTNEKDYLPEVNDWNDVDGKIGYQTRNLKLATDCDVLYCFTIPWVKTKCYHHSTPQYHEKTAGCWTMKEALKMNKKCHLIVTK